MRAMIRRSDFYLIPNVLSLSRVAAIPLIVTLSYYEQDLWSAGVFALAGISDYVDGWIARRYGYESKLGILLDPLADKVIILSVMVMLLFLGRLHIQIGDYRTDWIAPLLVIVTVGRETAITGLRSIASSIGMLMPADRWGKLKTWVQFFAILFILIHREPLDEWGKYFLVFSVITALASGIRYFVYFVKKLPET